MDNDPVQQIQARQNERRICHIRWSLLLEIQKLEPGFSDHRAAMMRLENHITRCPVCLEFIRSFPTDDPTPPPDIDLEEWPLEDS